jgi:surfeit locus 1 family protein
MDVESLPAPVRSRATLVALSLGFALLFAGFVALGVWQVARLQWKLALIDQVQQRLAAPPVAAPGPPAWPTLGPSDAYRRVRVAGVFDHDRETCTQAVTELGAGCWIITPLRTREGWWLLVNRGFVPPERRAAATRAAGQLAGPVVVEGLLRISEPRGGFLRRNDPAGNRWHSRDVAAIAAARGLPAAEIAPYFIDAANTVEGGPVGGLTVVRFHNSHLAYALTWFALASLTVYAALRVMR